MVGTMKSNGGKGDRNRDNNKVYRDKVTQINFSEGMYVPEWKKKLEKLRLKPPAGTSQT